MRLPIGHFGRHDLKMAGIAYRDGEGRYFDFHALRHCTDTFLNAAGVPPTVVMLFMRHKKPSRTLVPCAARLAAPTEAGEGSGVRGIYERVVLSVDPAVSVRPGSDCSALGVLGRTATNEVHCLFDGIRALLVRQARFGPKVKAVVQTRDKASRVHALSVPVEKGTFRLRGGRPAQVEAAQQGLYDEMTTFLFGEHDDLLDAAATGMAHLLDRPEPCVW